jgi:hypothetical protein
MEMRFAPAMSHGWDLGGATCSFPLDLALEDEEVMAYIDAIGGRFDSPSK